MLALDQTLLKDLLQALLRRSSIVKIGFGVIPDLLAMSAALGVEGGGCVSRTNSLVDIRLLYRGLQSLGALVPEVSGNSLSGKLMTSRLLFCIAYLFTGWSPQPLSAR